MISNSSLNAASRAELAEHKVAWKGRPLEAIVEAHFDRRVENDMLKHSGITPEKV